MASEENKGLLTRWVEKNREKVLAMLEGLAEEGETIENWVMCETAPAEILDWLRVLDWIHHALTKNYVLCLTNKRFLIIRTKGVSTNVKDSEALPLSGVVSIDERQRPLTAHLVVRLADGRQTTYKEVIREAATSFVADFESLGI